MRETEPQKAERKQSFYRYSIKKLLYKNFFKGEKDCPSAVCLHNNYNLLCVQDEIWELLVFLYYIRYSFSCETNPFFFPLSES